MWYNGRFAALAVAVTLVVSMGASAVAQDAATTASASGGGRGGRGGGLYGVALKLPGITDEQKAKLEKMQADGRTKMQELRKSGGSTGPADYQKLQEEQKKEIEGVLTDEQKKEFETKAAEMRARWGSGRMGGRTTSVTVEEKTL
ncbi:MAG: hypothetical protein ACR2IE_13335 [Candidatus Sumerlaeaceae bacterium]